MDNNSAHSNTSVISFDPQTGRASLPPKFDTMTGKPLAPPQNFDPMTGERITPPQNFDPMTGEKIAPPQNFDPMTGERIAPPQNFDPMTGERLAPAPKFDMMTGQPISPSHQPSVPLPQVQTAPQQPSNNEFFVGINLLSKIGVIFIIIGVMAFSAVSEDFLSPAFRTVIIFALGAFMAILGEVFYRLKSVIFARALTIGGIAELMISVLIGQSSFCTLNDVATLIIGAVIAAGGLALGIRYNSQTITAVTAVVGFFPSFALCYQNFTAELAVSLVFILLFQTALVILCQKKNWQVPIFLSIGANLFLSVTCAVVIDPNEAVSMTALLIILSAYSLASAAAYIAPIIADSYKNFGSRTACSLTRFILVNSLALLFCFSILADSHQMAFGFITLSLAVVYFVLAAVFKKLLDSCSLMKILMNTAISLLCISIFAIFSGDLVYIIFHICAAGLLIAGFITNIRFVKNWGFITCGFAQFYFMFICLGGIESTAYIYQYAVNALIWLIIVTVLAMRSTKGSGFKAFSIAAMFNLAFMGNYMVLRLVGWLENTDLIDNGGFVIAFLSFALVWMITALITGKLRFLDNTRYIVSIIMYSIAIFTLFLTNLTSPLADVSGEIVFVVFSMAVNVISVLAAFDMALNIKGLAPKFARAIAMAVSLYAMFSITFALGANEIVSFTNCFISIFYLLIAVIWIVLGFVRRFPLMRRFGLALTLLSAAKLFLLDFAGTDDVGRTLMFILFGIVLLIVSCIYAVFEKKIRAQEALEKQQNISQ